MLVEFQSLKQYIYLKNKASITAIGGSTAVLQKLAPIKFIFEPHPRYNYFSALIMKKILTAVLVTFCIILFFGPHGMVLPVILMAVSGLLTFAITFDLDLLDTLLYSLMIIAGFIGTFLVRRKLKNPKLLIKATLTVLLLNIGLAWLILDMSDSVNNALIYTSIPFWITSVIAMILILKNIKQVPTK